MIHPRDPHTKHRLLPWLIASIAAHLAVFSLLSLRLTPLPEPDKGLDVSIVTLSDASELPPEPDSPSGTPGQGAPAPGSAVLSQPLPPASSPTPAVVSPPSREPGPTTPSPGLEPTPPARPADRSSEPAQGSSGLAENPRLALRDLLPDRATWPGVGTGIGGDVRTGNGTGRASSGGTGTGTGLVPIPEVEERIQADAREVIAKHRVERGLVTPEMNQITNRLEDHWEIKLSEVHRWPTRGEQRMEYWAPPGLESQAPAPPCAYRRYSLAQVRLVIDRDGTLVSTEIVRSSGSRRYDREALDLVRRAAPFPPPAARDLDANGHSRSTWDIGVRDYSLSNCIYIGGKRLVKDVTLLGSY